MSFDLTSTSNKAGGYMVDYMAAMNSIPASGVNLNSMKAFAKGILQALSEDEDGFNVSVSGSINAASGNYIQAANGGKNLISASASVNATSGTINYGLTLTSPIVTISGLGTNGYKLELQAAPGSTSFTWKTGDGSTFNGTIYYHVRGS